MIEVPYERRKEVIEALHEVHTRWAGCTYSASVCTACNESADAALATTVRSHESTRAMREMVLIISALENGMDSLRLRINRALDVPTNEKYAMRKIRDILRGVQE